MGTNSIAAAVCEATGTHGRVVQDRFSLDMLRHSGRSPRSIPGDCFCLDCHQPIAAWWNNGKPEAIKPTHATLKPVG